MPSYLFLLLHIIFVFGIWLATKLWKSGAQVMSTGFVLENSWYKNVPRYDVEFPKPVGYLFFLCSVCGFITALFCGFMLLLGYIDLILSL